MKIDADVGLISFDLSEYMKQLANDLMGAARSAQDAAKQLEGGYQARLRDMIAAAYGLAAALSKDDRALAKFVKLPLFTAHNQQRPRIGTHVGEILMVANRFIFSATTRQDRDRCWKYATALRPCLEDGADASTIPEIIEKGGGIDKLSAIARSRRAAEEAMANEDDQAPDNGDDEGPEERDWDAENTDAPADSGQTGRLTAAALKASSSPSISSRGDLFVEIKPALLDVMLQTKKADRVRLIVRNVGRNSEGWVRFRAVKVVVLPEKKVKREDSD